MKTKGFSLSKQTFVDATALRYDWLTDGLRRAPATLNPNLAMCMRG